MEEAELRRERRPGVGPADDAPLLLATTLVAPKAEPGVDEVVSGLERPVGLLPVAVRSSRLPLAPPLDFLELFRLETLFRFSMSERRMGAGGPPGAGAAPCGVDSRDSRDKDRRIMAKDDLQRTQIH
jgi:hypothetical protein